MQNKNIERFESLLQSCDRDGMDKLLAFIRKSDFYTAPASTRFHNCHGGGLLEHSLNVYDCLMKKKDDATWYYRLEDIPNASLTIIALLHDLCKAYTYSVEYKNKKIYSERGSKSDSQGRYDWESVPAFVYDDKMPLGHGSKSVFLASEYIKLTPIELAAINFHMGFTLPKEEYNTLSAAIRKWPVILAVHEADLEATYLLEKEE